MFLKFIKRMIVYDCLTTGTKTGFIEVIKDAM